jgi:two-component system response regulator WspF
MDLIMPVMDGVEATRRIMAETRAPSSSSPSTASRTCTGCSRPWAMAPWMWSTRRPWARAMPEAAAPLLRKILNIGWLIGQRGPAAPGVAQRASASAAAGGHRLVGGRPGGAGSCSRACHEAFPPAIVLVQHVDQVFAAGMAEWLSTASALRCAWPAKANRRSRGRCCWPAPTTTFAC